jgi:hypothetical protein
MEVCKFTQTLHYLRHLVYVHTHTRSLERLCLLSNSTVVPVRQTVLLSSLSAFVAIIRSLLPPPFDFNIDPRTAVERHFTQDVIGVVYLLHTLY